MLSAILRLFLISAASLILFILAVFFVRQMGMQQNFSPAPHPWFQMTTWNIWRSVPPDLCEKENARWPGASWIVALTIKFDSGQWRDECGTDLTTRLKTTPVNEWLLIVKANDVQNLDNLVDNVGPFDATKRFAIYADAQRVAKYLRKKAPQWLYAADSASLMRLQMFESLWMETAIDFWPDFVIASSDKNNANHLRPRAAAELARRQKRIVWNNEGATRPPEYPVRGIMTTRPTP